MKTILPNKKEEATTFLCSPITENIGGNNLIKNDKRMLALENSSLDVSFSISGYFQLVKTLVRIWHTIAKIHRQTSITNPMVKVFGNCSPVKSIFTYGGYSSMRYNTKLIEMAVKVSTHLKFA